MAPRNKYVFFSLVFAVISYTLFFTRLSVLKYMSFFSFAPDDLAISNNILWHTSRGHFLFQSIGERFLDFHFGFFYIVVSLFYKLYPHIFSLFVLEHFALALGIMPVYYILKQRFNSKPVALLFGFSYLLFNPLHYFSFVDRDILTGFSITFLLFSFYFFGNRLSGFIIFSLLAMMSKEEAGFVVCMFGLYAFLKKKGLKWKVVPVAIGISYFILIWCFIAPLLNYDPSNNPYIWNFFGSNPNKYSFQELTAHNFMAITDRLFSFRHFVSLVKFIGFPFNIFCLFAPAILLISLPTIIAAQLSVEKYFVSLESVHHLVFLVPFAFLSSLFGLSRILNLLYKIKFVARSVPVKILPWIAAVLFLTFNIYSNLGKNIHLPAGGEYRDIDISDTRFIRGKNMYSSIFYTQDRKDQVAWEFIKLIPKDKSVSTSDTYLPVLSSRDKVYHFGTKKEINDRDGHDLEAEYVFLNKNNDYLGFGGREVSHKQISEKARLLLNRNYTVIKEDENFILLKKSYHE